LTIFQNTIASIAITVNYYNILTYKAGASFLVRAELFYSYERRCGQKDKSWARDVK